jgi:hypothetical protein
MVEAAPEKKRRHHYTLSDLLQIHRLSDGILVGLVCFSHLVLLLSDWYHGSYSSVYQLNGAWHNTLMSQYLFGRSIDQIHQYYRSHEYSLSNVFPLYPFLLSIFKTLFAKSLFVATHILSLFFSSLSALVFYRLCLTLRFVTKPLLTSCLFTMYPFRSLLLKYIGNEYNIVTLLISCVFLGRKIHHGFLFCISLLLLMLATESGFVITLMLLVNATVGRNKIELRNIYISTFASILIMMWFHKNYAYSSFAYVKYVVRGRYYPFKQLLADASSIDTLRQFHGMYGSYIVPLIAGGILIAVDRSIGLPVTIATVWAASRPGAPTFDLLCPLEAFAVLLGLDLLISSAKFQCALFVITPLYCGCALYITSLYLTNPFMINQ